MINIINIDVISKVFSLYFILLNIISINIVSAGYIIKFNFISL